MTKLEAVRRLLQDAHNMYAETLDTGKASPAAWAERAIDEIEPSVQLQGWHYNTWTELVLSPVLFEFDNAAWTVATKTLSQTGKFAAASVGQTLTITDGATAGDYTVATVIGDDAVTLAEELDAGDIASGIAGIAKTNHTAVPVGTLAIDSSHASFSRNITQIGAFLYDLDNNTDQFDDDITVSGEFRMKWECIPLYVQEFILAKATVIYARRYGFKDRLPLLMNSEKAARTEALRKDLEHEDVNVLDTAHARAVRGQRSNVDSRDAR
jgi:hypothetical protein